jgi:hypothetical protein
LKVESWTLNIERGTRNAERGTAGFENNPVEFGARPGYLSFMRRLFVCLLLCCLPGFIVAAEGATGRVIKVLPQFLDLKGRHTLSPSLYERDAYQAFLREHPEQRSGVRFAVQWKSRGAAFAPLKLRVELRGTARGDLPSRTVLEAEVKPGGWLSQWTFLPLTGADYEKFGDTTAWRVTLWEGEDLLGEQTSFLW